MALRRFFSSLHPTQLTERFEDDAKNNGSFSPCCIRKSQCHVPGKNWRKLLNLLQSINAQKPLSGQRLGIAHVHFFLAAIHRACAMKQDVRGKCLLVRSIT